jgi:hypothetical protein
MTRRPEQDATVQGGATRRRPYRAPRLERLGTLTEITATVALNNHSDHAGPHATLTKTS